MSRHKLAHIMAPLHTDPGLLENGRDSAARAAQGEALGARERRALTLVRLGPRGCVDKRVALRIDAVLHLRSQPELLTTHGTAKVCISLMRVKYPLECSFLFRSRWTLWLHLGGSMNGCHTCTDTPLALTHHKTLKLIAVSSLQLNLRIPEATGLA